MNSDDCPHFNEWLHSFGRNVTLRGTVIGEFKAFTTCERLTDVLSVVANEGQRIDIPDGCVLENRELWLGAPICHH